MTIIRKSEGDVQEISLEGRLDVLAAGQLEKDVLAEIEQAGEIVFDFERLTYTSSAGLRVILETQKLMKKKGGAMKIRHVCPDIMEVFEMTHFIDFLTIEP